MPAKTKIFSTFFELEFLVEVYLLVEHAKDSSGIFLKNHEILLRLGKFFKNFNNFALYRKQSTSQMNYVLRNFDFKHFLAWNCEKCR